MTIHISLQLGWLGYCNIPPVFLSKIMDYAQALAATQTAGYALPSTY
jgi:hypothetical protein